MQELTSLRNRHYKVFGGSGKTREVKLYTSPVHFKDSSGKWKDIDTRVVNSNLIGYKWRNHSNQFYSHFKENLNSNEAIAFEHAGATVAATPIGLALYNTVTKQYQIIEFPNDVFGSISGKVLSYGQLYQNCNFKYRFGKDGVKEFIDVIDKELLPVPEDYGMASATTELLFVNKISTYGVDSVLYDGSPSFNENTLEIQFIKDNEVAVTMPVYFAWSGANNSAESYEVKKHVVFDSSEMYVLHGLAYTDLMSTDSYPIVVDVTLNLGDAANDGTYEYSTYPGGGVFNFSNSTTTLTTGAYEASKSGMKTRYGFLLFPSFPLNAADTVDSADFVCVNTYTSYLIGSIHAHSEVGLVAPTSNATAEVHHAILLTTGIALQSVASGSTSTTSIINIINAIKALTGWNASNKNILFRYASTQENAIPSIAASEHTTYNEAYISLTYTPAASSFSENIDGVSSPAKIDGIAIASISKVNGV